MTIGLSGFAVRFGNLVIKEDEGALEDGVLENSFLENFRVRLDFRVKRITLLSP